MLVGNRLDDIGGSAKRKGIGNFKYLLPLRFGDRSTGKVDRIVQGLLKAFQTKRCNTGGHSQIGNAKVGFVNSQNKATGWRHTRL